VSVVLQCALFVILASSAVAALLRLSPTVADRLEQWDTLLVIPDWKFFAPTPNGDDYHLVVRVHSRDPGTWISSWHTIASSKRNSLRPRLFDPDRRLRKAMVDLAAHYIAVARIRPESSATDLRPSVSASMVYLLVLALGERSIRGADVDAFQVGLVRTRDDQDAPGDVIFISDVHPAWA
jgi:hypothetical protein